VLTPEKVHNVSLGAVKPADIPEPHRQAAHGAPLGGAPLLGARGGRGEDGASLSLEVVLGVDKRRDTECETGIEGDEEGHIRLQQSALRIGQERLKRGARADRSLSLCGKASMPAGVGGKALKETVRILRLSRSIGVENAVDDTHNSLARSLAGKCCSTTVGFEVYKRARLKAEDILFAHVIALRKEEVQGASDYCLTALRVHRFRCASREQA